MIRSGTSQETVTSTPEQVAEFQEEYKRELGLKGITAAMGEDEVVGYPSDVDSQGDYVATVEPTDVPARELKPGDIGYSSRESGPQVLGRN